MERVNKDNDDEQQERVRPTGPSRLRRQLSWMDNLLPKPTWEESIRTKPTYLANFDWSKAFWNRLNGWETMNILAMKGRGGTKGIAQLWVIGKIEHATLVLNFSTRPDKVEEVIQLIAGD